MEAFVELIENKIRESIEIKQKILSDKKILSDIEKAAKMIIHCYRINNGRVFFAGNGGSAADAQHLAAELVSKFYMEREALPAEALSTNTSILTAIGNDYSFDRVFSRQLEANAKKGDVFVGISTSGNAQNIIEALSICKMIGVKSIGLTGETGGNMTGLCDLLIKVPSIDTPRVQESHIMIGHIICEIVEKSLFGNKK